MGHYELTVTDAEGYVRKKVFNFGYPVSVGPMLVRAQVNADNSVSRTVVGGAWTSAVASRNRLNPGETGWVEVEVAEAGSVYMLGLSRNNTTVNYTSIENALYVNLLEGFRKL